VLQNVKRWIYAMSIKAAAWLSVFLFYFRYVNYMLFKQSFLL